MEHAGLDLGKRESQIAIIIEAGELSEKRMRTERERLRQFFADLPAPDVWVRFVALVQAILSREGFRVPIERAERDAHRSRLHEAFIDSCNALSRRFAAQGKDLGWRRSLGDDGQRIGDLACYLHCVLGLEAR